MKKIVTIGGGSGSFVVLRGLKKFFDITAIVSTFDSGGSSGVLRDEYGILPPGDVRRCLLALADDDTNQTLRQLFNYRFNKEGTLNGHSFGNLLLTALTQITDGYPEAIDRAARLLNCHGQILPVSLDQAELCAELDDGQVIRGEAHIDVPKHDPDLGIKRVYLSQATMLYDKARLALLEADLIIIGPGDLYTSLIPNLLVGGMAEALQESRGKKLYISNLMTKPGETTGFTASRFTQEVLMYSGLPTFDYLLCNSRQLTAEQSARYAAEAKVAVEFDRPTFALIKEVIATDLVTESDVVRHNSDKITQVIKTLKF